MPLQFYPIGSYQPDQPNYTSSVSTECMNVVPLTKKTDSEGKVYVSYGPVNSLVDYSNELDDVCLGSYTIINSSGNAYIFAGTATSLYQLDSSSKNFVNISGDTYSTTDKDHWNATSSDDNVIMTNFSDPIQVYNIETSSIFTDLSADAPNARYVALVKDFLVTANISHTSYGNKPNWVWWSGAGDITSWPTLGTDNAIQVQSDYQSLNTQFGWVQGIVSGLGSSDAAIFQEHAITRMNYVGPDNIFAFDVAEGARGTPSPKSLVQVGSVVYYLGEDGFYVFDGNNSKSIGAERIDNTFFNNLDQNYFDSVYGSTDPLTKNIFWIYPSTASSNGRCDRCLIYNYSINEWSEATFDCEVLTQSLSTGLTIDDFDASLGWTIDEIPFPADSRVWAASGLLLAGFTSEHKMAHFVGTTLAPSVETQELHNDNTRLVVLTTRPIVDGGTPSIAVEVRDNIKDTPTTNTAVSENIAGYCPQRHAGKYVRLKLTLPTDSDFTHIEGIEANIQGLGNR